MFHWPSVLLSYVVVDDGKREGPAYVHTERKGL